MFNKGEEIEAREDRVGEEMGGELNELGMGKISPKVEVSKVNGCKEGVGRDDRVNEKIDAGERGDVGGGGGKKTQGGHLRRCRELGDRSGPGMRREERDHFSLGMGLKYPVGERGGAEMHRAESGSGVDQLHQFGVAGKKPLGTEGTRQSRLEGKRGAREIEVEDEGAGGG
jgi:hypothetical protein